MTKHLQKFALMTIALLSSVAASAQTFDVGDLRYTVLSGTENVKVEAVDKSSISGALTIPATVENDGTTYKVTEIAYQGFYYARNITSITFEGSNLETIGGLAFKDTQSVTGTVTIPASVKEIARDGFCRCFADQFVFAEGSQLETLGEAAFWEGKFTTMPNLPNTLTTIGNECFKRCSNLTAASLPASVTKLPYATFAECPKLTSATIAATVTEIGDAAFWSCPLLANVTFEESSAPLKLVSRTFQYCYALTSISLPDRINQMGEGVFLDCTGLTSAHFPSGLTTVPAKTFDNCYAMSSITGIDNVTRIESSAFGDWHEITSFTIPAGVTFIGDYAFANQTNCATYTFAGNNVTSIGSYAFQNNKAMTSFTLPSTVTSLGNSVFEGCSELTSFDLPSGVSIGTGLFSGCSKLAAVNLPADLPEIPNHMFNYCSALSGKFTIPASVTRIGRDAFRACNNITEVEFPANSVLQTIDYEAFYMDPSLTQLERFIMPNTVTTLGNGALRGCKKLDWDNFHLSTGVTFLPGHTFCDCGFTEFDLKQTNVTTLEFNVFDGNCFKEFHLPKSVTMTGDANFYANHKLERFYFEDGYDLTEIRYCTFAYCENLNYMYLPVATPPSLGYYAMPDAKQVFMDVPAEAIATYKATPDWANFKYALTLESTGVTDLALDDASQRLWAIYEYNGHRYLYNDQSTYNSDHPNNLMSWTFNNTVEKEYSLLFNACNRYYTDKDDCLEVSLVKYNADGTQTTVQTKTVKIDKCSNSYYAFADKYEQVLINFDNALETGKYAVTFKRLGSNGKFVWNAQMVPTADICIIEPVAKPAGAGEIAVTGDLIQVKNDFKEITLTAATMEGESWISFANWTVDDAEVGTEATYTFTPSASTKVVANYNITPQNIPADLDNFVQTQAVLYPANPTNSSSSIYWYPNTGGQDNFVYIRDGNSATYFVKSTKPALYNLKFKTSSRNYNTSAYIVDVINAEGNVIFTKQNDIAQTSYGWYNDDMNQENVAITTPLLPNEVYSVRFTFISKSGETSEIANLNFVQFEAAAIVPDAIALDKTAATVKVDETATLTAMLSASTGDAITEGYDGIAWTSSNEAIATVTAAGVVTAVAPGTATITAKATGRTDVELTAACEVTVPQHVTDITVPAAQSIYVGDEVTLEATAAPENAEDKSFTWTSNNTDVATVDATGKVTAVAKGDAVITVTAADRNKVSKTVAVNVKQPVTDITGIPAEAQIIYVGENVQVNAVAAPETANNTALTWTSNDEAVATVDQTGKITAVKAGAAVITVTAADRGTFKKTINVTVKQQVTDITVVETAEVYAGETVTIEATTVPTEPTDGTLTWATADETTATVENGVVTGVKAGTVNITVTAADRNTVSKTIAVTVKQAVTAITLNKTAETIHKNETLQLNATCAPADATQKEVTWTSSNTDVATVSETGLVTAIAGGVATITATAKDDKGATAQCVITVDVPVTSVTLDKTAENVYILDKVVLTATVNPEDATDATLTWSSSDDAVATVVDGTVTAIAPGTAVITATSNYDATKTATFTLTVMDVIAQGDGANKLLFHKVVNTTDLTENKVAWKSDTDHSWVANSIVLTDANKYENSYDVAATSLTYNRTFEAVAWQALYVPFAMQYTDWSSVADVAYINNVHQWDKDGDGVIDLTVLEFITEKTAVEANVPYVIRPKAAGDMSIELSNATLKASPAEDGYVDCSSTRTKYTLTGTYKQMDMYGTDRYAMDNEGNFCKAANATVTLKPFRTYLTIESRTSSSSAAPLNIMVMVDGEVVGDATGLELINAVFGDDTDAIYNLSGLRVGKNAKGIVIKNGKKVLKK